MTPQNDTPRLCFFAERQVGIGAAAGALEPYARQHPALTWVDVTYTKENGFIEKLPLPPRVRGTMRGFLQTGSALRRGSFDGLIFLTHNPAVLRPWTLEQFPTVLWTDVTPRLLDAQAEQYDHPVSKSGLMGSLKHALVRRGFRRATLCVGWSDWARRSFVADYGVADERTAVVAPGIDLALWDSPAPRPSNGLPRLLFVGGDFQRKGGDLLLDVYRERLRGRCELDLVTRAAVAEESGVRVHRGLSAASDELRELYRNAAALVLPTRGDCFSIAALEAMASGLPVVISAVGGIPEIVEQGASGYALAPGDRQALGQAIEELLSNEPRRRAMGARGRELVEQRFDARKTAARLVELVTAASRRGGRH